jgi:hypothetical protein
VPTAEAAARVAEIVAAGLAGGTRA